jgi:predicted nucleic acid-binding protein
MSALVLDASVAAAALFQEEHADRAARLLGGRSHLHVPDLFHAEIANVIWKRHGRGEISPEEAVCLLADIRRLPLQVTPCGLLIDSALMLALRSGRSVYDCVYLALAVVTGAVLVSADSRLVNALARTPLAKHVMWIGSAG